MSKARKLYKRLAPLFTPFGLVYAGLMRARRRAYKQGSLQSFRPACPTVSVGNISWGGTGKTPVVAWLINWALERGLKPAVLSRGYGGKPATLPLLVGSLTPPAESGDEPLMLAKLYPEAKVLVDPKRARAAEYAGAHFPPDLFILDDGFQHMAIARDFNLVLLTPEDLTGGWNRVIPGGSWREGADALADAQAVLLRLGGPPSAQDIAAVLAYGRERLPGIPLFPFYLKNTGLRRLGRAGQFSADLAGKPYNLFCGVGSPAGVLAGATALLGQPPKQFTRFEDHHAYSSGDLIELLANGLELVCTEKDAVKLEANYAAMLRENPVWAMQAEPVFLNGQDREGASVQFAGFWAAAWAEISAVPNPSSPKAQS